MNFWWVGSKEANYSLDERSVGLKSSHDVQSNKGEQKQLEPYTGCYSRVYIKVFNYNKRFGRKFDPLQYGHIKNYSVFIENSKFSLWEKITIAYNIGIVDMRKVGIVMIRFRVFEYEQRSRQFCKNVSLTSVLSRTERGCLNKGGFHRVTNVGNHCWKSSHELSQRQSCDIKK